MRDRHEARNKGNWHRQEPARHKRCFPSELRVTGGELRRHIGQVGCAFATRDPQPVTGLCGTRFSSPPRATHPAGFSPSATSRTTLPSAEDLFTRVWPQHREPIEKHWYGYLDGHGALEDAIDKVVGSIQR
jgi:hypothetical protein